MEEINRSVGLFVGVRGLAGDGDRVVLLSGVSGRPNRSALLLPSVVCLLRSESNKSLYITFRSINKCWSVGYHLLFRDFEPYVICL
jgi:hypothetical protein